MITEKTHEQLAREDLIRQALEVAAKTIEKKNGNATYMRAWEIAAKMIRDLIPSLTERA